MGDSRTETSQASSGIAWLLALTIAAIVYGSFYPFDWSWQRFATAQNGAMPTRLPWGPALRSDVVANLLFYIPLGALLAALGRRDTRGWQHLVRAVALGTALSVCVEFLQYGAPTRTPSLTDTALNAISTLVGALGALVVQRLVGIPRLRRRAFDPAIILMLAAWAGFHIAPFMPNLRFAQLRESLDTVLTLQWTLSGAARFMAGYLILSMLLRTLVKREHFWLSWLLFVAVTLFARAIVVGQSLPFDELLGLLAALPLIGLFRGVPQQKASLPVLLLVIVGWFIYGLAPFDFVNRAATFHWLPLQGFLDNEVQRGYLQFLEKLFLFTGVVWLTVKAGGSVWFAASLGFVLAACIEFAQRYLPGRIAEVTDPLLVLVAALVVSIGVAIDKVAAPTRSGKSRR